MEISGLDDTIPSTEPFPGPTTPPALPFWERAWKAVHSFDISSLKDRVQKLDKNSIRWIIASLATGALVVTTKIASDFENSPGIKAVCYLLLSGQVAVVAKTVYDLGLPHLQKLGKEQKSYRSYIEAGCYLLPAAVSLASASLTFSVLPNLIRDVTRSLVPFLAGAATGAAACYFAMKKGT